MKFRKIVLFIISLMIVTKIDNQSSNLVIKKATLLPNMKFVEEIAEITKKEIKDEVRYSITDIHTATWFDLTGRKTASGA